MNYANKEYSADENSLTPTLLLERTLDFPFLSSIIIDEVYFFHPYTLKLDTLLSAVCQIKCNHL